MLQTLRPTVIRPFEASACLHRHGNAPDGVSSVLTSLVRYADLTACVGNMPAKRAAAEGARYPQSERQVVLPAGLRQAVQSPHGATVIEKAVSGLPRMRPGRGVKLGREGCDTNVRRALHERMKASWRCCRSPAESAARRPPTVRYHAAREPGRATGPRSQYVKAFCFSGPIAASFIATIGSTSKPSTRHASIPPVSGRASLTPDSRNCLATDAADVSCGHAQ